MRTSVYIDSDTREAMKKQKRPFTASALLRWMMKAVSTTNKEWDSLIKKDVELKAVQEYLRPRMKRIFDLE
jgi:hypothetical protein